MSTLGRVSIRAGRVPMVFCQWLFGSWHELQYFSCLPCTVHNAENLAKGCILVTIMNLENLKHCFNYSGFVNRKIKRNETISFLLGVGGGGVDRRWFLLLDF